MSSRATPMSAYVSANTKYYSAGNASGEMGHVNRLFEKNSNVVPHPENIQWSEGNLCKKFLSLVAKAEGARGKKFQHNSNLFLDTVVALSRERVDELRGLKDFDFEGEMNAAIQRFEQLFLERFGFTPIGSGFHGDEGHINPVTKEFLRNYHFHMLSLNFDFNTKKQPLRSMKNSDWSIVQDLVGEAFAPLGFVRGESKEITKTTHLDKSDFVEVELAKKKAQLDEMQSKLDQLDVVLHEKHASIEQLNQNILNKESLFDLYKSDFQKNEEAIAKQRELISKQNFVAQTNSQKLSNMKAEMESISNKINVASAELSNQKRLIFDSINTTMDMLHNIAKTTDEKERSELIHNLFYTFHSPKPHGVNFNYAIEVLSSSLDFLGRELRQSIIDQVIDYPARSEISVPLKNAFLINKK